MAGRTALVTGSTSGIGAAIAVAFAAAGAHVAVSGRDPKRGAAVVDRIRADGGRADFLAADLGASVAAVEQLAADATDLLGRVDVLVNNAGIFPPAPTLATEPETFERVVDVNVRAPFFLVKALVPGMVERGGGVVITLGSWVASVGVASGALYAASKATVEQLTRGWAAEFGPSGVRFNAIAPGITDTEGNGPNADVLAGVAARFPAGRLGRPDEIAAAAVFLAGDSASCLHGSTLLVDGGALGTRALIA